MKLGDYPEVVNENVTRIVASTVVLLGAISIYYPNPYSLALLLYGFFARVSYGPKFEPFALFTSSYIVPKLGISFVPTAGPPKRFAQLIGLIFAITSIILFSLDQLVSYKVALSILVVFASLESFLSWCAGCFVFAILMKIGVIPKDICERCNQLTYNK
ncbi:MAG: DUF4395 domain-containing protein [Leptospira sp.]|nr:DUF4395 domain-containing protein [Leptospira sp.]